MKRLSKKNSKIAVRYNHVDYEETIYEFDELSPEAKETALKELREVYNNGYAETYMEMVDEDCCDGAWVGMELQDIGLPLEDITGVYWDWTYAWININTDYNSFIKASGIEIDADPEVKEMVEYAFNEKYGYFSDLTSEGYRVSMYTIESDEVSDVIADYFSDDIEDDEEQEYVDKYFNQVEELCNYVVEEFEERVQKANDWLTKQMDYYLDPPDEDLLDLLDISEYEFDEDGTIR